MSGSGSEGGYESAAECIAAGMYWFGQSDLSAAEAWWRRALKLEPGNSRAQACLRLLERSSSTGFKADSWARLPATPGDRGPASGSPPQPGAAPARSGPPEPVLDPPAVASSSGVFEDPAAGATTDLDTGRLEFEELHGTEDLDSGSIDLDPSMFPGLEVAHSAETDPGSIDLYGEASGYAERPRHGSGDLGRAAGGDASGASGLERFVAEAAAEAEALPIRSPWDEGPSRTSVITVDSGTDFDAVAEPTPLPELDRERFFNRGDPSSRDEIEAFLRATGDLPEMPDEESSTTPPELPPPGVMSDDLGPIGVIQDGIATEPAHSVRTGSINPLQAARDKYQLHDFQGVLEALEDYVPSESEQTEVRNMLAESRANLLRMYEAKIGSLEQIPTVRVTSEEVIWLNLNHRAGFILSQVDGTVSYEDLISLSGMPRLDTVRILTELLDQNVIGV